MNAERAGILSVFQEAARIERDALRSARNQIEDLISECEADEYPRMAALDAEIRKVEASIAQREIRIEKALKNEAAGPEPTRLSLLLSWQDDARQDRDDLVEARDAIEDEEDERFIAITREIAEVDEEILARAEEIETLAALARV